MRVRNLVIYNLIFIICVLGTAEVVKYQLTGDHLFQKRQVNNAVSAPEACTTSPPPSRPTTNDPQLKVVAEYEAACKSAFFSEMMIFTNMPVSVEKAQLAADKMTGRLNEFKNFNITPIVIMEPDSEWGLVDFHESANGFYDQFIAAYFERLKSNGIDSKAMGIWIPFPEPQQDFWNNNGDPDDYAKSVNRYFKTLRNVYPDGRTAILLDSQVGENNRASQLLAYTRLLDNSLITMAGLQGFPWHPTAEGDERQSVTSASIFSSAALAEEVAKSLNTKQILLNVGTYRHRKAVAGGDLAVTTAERQQTLDSITAEVDKLNKAGYAVTVNLFSENKLTAKEGVDWSYWQPGQSASSSHTVLFTKFIHDLMEIKTTVSIFDSRN